MSETESLYERLKIAFQTNVDESDYIRDSEVSHIYDKKQKKYLDFYHKENQSNLHALFQTETQLDLTKEGFYPLSIDTKARLKILLDFIGIDSFEELIKAIKLETDNLSLIKTETDNLGLIKAKTDLLNNIRLQTDKLSFDESNNLLVIST